MKAVICAINSKYIHSSLAAWYLLAGVEAYCDTSVTAEVIEGTINMDTAAVAARIIEQKPDVIGFSCYIWNITFIKRLLPVLKNALPEAVIVLGGPEVSYNAGEVLGQEPLVGYVLSGEGEAPFALLLIALADGAPPDGIPGVSFRKDARIVVREPYVATDEPPDPYGEAYFKALNGRIAYLETSRGCPFSCAFCLSGREGNVRFFDIERAKHDLVRLSNSGTQTVKLVDRTFNVNKKRALELFRFIIENYGGAIPRDIRFHFEIGGDLLDEETLELLKTASKGFFQFEIGLQSFNEKTLEAVNRKTDTVLLKRNIERLISFGNIHIHIDLIAGLPYEYMKSFADSFNTAYTLRPHILQLGFLKLLHGSAMRMETDMFPCVFSPDPPYEVRSTPWLSESGLVRLREAEDALERLYNSGRFPRTLQYVLERTGLTPFELFLEAGSFIAEREIKHISLDNLTEQILGFFSAHTEIDGAALRDALVCDRLATNPSRLPKGLQVRDSRLKNAVSVLSKHHGKPPGGVRRGYALLQAENAVVYAEYDDKDPVTGEYHLHRIDLNL